MVKVLALLCFQLGVGMVGWAWDGGRKSGLATVLYTWPATSDTPALYAINTMH